MSGSREKWPALPHLEVRAIATSHETPRSTFGPFLLDRYALTWIVVGGGVTRFDDHEHATAPGTVLTMRPGTVLRHDWGEKKSFQTFIVFDVPHFPKGWPRPETWIRERRLEGSETFFEIWRFLLSASHGGRSGELERATVELLLRMMLSGEMGGSAEWDGDLPRPIEKALDFLLARARARERPELPAIARAAGVSPQHLCRLFRKELDASPLECAEMLRLERAASALERTDRTLTEIADELGYSSAFHLSKNFKRAYGISPRPYREAFHGGLATRPGGLVFKNHRLRSYLYEKGPGQVLVTPSPRASAR